MELTNHITIKQETGLTYQCLWIWVPPRCVTKAPKNEKCCTVITKSYELHEDDETAEEESEEVVGAEHIETIWNSQTGIIVESGGSDDWKDDNDLVTSSTEPLTPVDNQ